VVEVRDGRRYECAFEALHKELVLLERSEDGAQVA
jgi:hypothetical protein